MSSDGPAPSEPNDKMYPPTTLESIHKLDEMTDLIKDFELLTDPATLINVITKYTTDGINIVRMENKKRGRKLLYCNDRFVEMSGRTREELMSARSLNNFTLPFAGQVAFGYIHDELTRGLISRGYGRWARPDGKENVHEYTASCIGIDGDNLLVIGIDRDVTNRHKLEDQLRQASKMEAIGKLAGGISHDFNNQLTVIKGYCDMIQQGQTDEQGTAEALTQIREATERATGLTNQLLTFSRRQLLDNRVINLNHVIEKITNPLKRMLGETIELEFIPAKDLFNVVIDQARITETIMNMVVNARDAMPGGGKLTISTENAKMDELFLTPKKDLFSEPQVMLSITDTGIGMDPNTVQYIFEPFFTTKDVGQGTGLGLSMAYGLIQQSGGQILVESKLGEGTTFRIYLPRTYEPLDKFAETAAEQITDLAGTETILIAEDEQAVLHLMFHNLRNHGYSAMGSVNPKAVQTLGEHYEGKIDLLVTDIIMPGLSGTELAQKLLAKRPDMKVLFVTGYAPSEIRDELLSEDSHILTKPFSAIDLARKVRQVLDKGKPAG